MKIVFFEIQEWENKLLKSNFPNAIFIKDKLTEENASKYIDAEIISTFIYSKITKNIIDQLLNLKYISIRSTGFDNIDLKICKDKNIKISNVPEYGSNTVAEFTFALLLNLTRKIYQSINQAKQLDFNHQTIEGIDLYGKTIGILGLGKIGKHVLQIAKGFGMKVLVYNHKQDQNLAEEMSFNYTNLDTLLADSDVISLHLPLTEKTHHVINTNNILKFKRGSYLINTARGELIDTEAILLGLEKEILEGVGLDVLEGEDKLTEETVMLNYKSPNLSTLKTVLGNHVLLNHPKVLITPHNAFNSKEALSKIINVTISNINNFLNNTLENLVF